MSVSDRRVTLAHMRELLERSRSLRRRVVASRGLAGVRRLLAEYQGRRLKETYADLAAQPRYRPAVDFFLKDLYGPVDYSQRDADIERVFPVMSRVLSGPALDSITRALELRTITQELDARMVEILKDELAVTDRLDAQTYEEGFRRCDDRPGRLRQVELIEDIGRTLDHVVNHPVTYATVMAARVPARLAGFGELQDFIERGLRAFRNMRGAQGFIAIVGERERSMLDTMFARAPGKGRG